MGSGPRDAGQSVRQFDFGSARHPPAVVEGDSGTPGARKLSRLCK
jgi:hypothetical protein